MVCERGTMFGYSDLIVDPRNIVLMRDCNCPVTMDITHALQQPAGKPLEVLCSTLMMESMLGRCMKWQIRRRGKEKEKS